MKRSLKKLKELINITNENFKNIGLKDCLSVRASSSEIPVYTIYNTNFSGLANIVYCGTLKECELYLEGMEWVINHLNYKKIIITNDKVSKNTSINLITIK